MELNAAIKESLEEDVILFILPSAKYRYYMGQIVSSFIKQKSKLCLVSLNDSYEKFSSDLQKKNLTTKDIFFVDGTPPRKGKEKIKNEKVSYISTPEAYTEISIATKKACDEGAEKVIFDSLSSLFIYGKHEIILKYIHDLINFARNNNKKIFFTILQSDYEEKITKKIEMLVDKVLIIGEEVSAAKADAKQLLGNLFGPKAEKIAESYPQIKKTDALLNELKTILSGLVGPENAQKQLDELYEKYGKNKSK